MGTTSCGGFADCGGYDGPMNRAIVFRGNSLLNNAGFSIGGLTDGAIVEHNFVAANSVGLSVDNTTTASVFVRGNTFLTNTSFVKHSL